METRNSRGTIAEALGGTARQRGVKLGIIAGCITIFLLFGASALQHGSASTIDLESGQIAGLLLDLLPGFLTVAIAAVLAYYAGLSGPTASSGEGSRDGLISGSITMLLFWVGQTLYILVDTLRTPQGLALTNFVSTRLIAALLFFVVGGALGWAGSRAAARRAHSILEPPSDNFLTLTDASIPKPLYSNQSAQPEADTTASGLENREENDLTQQEATIEASEQEWDVS
ncbi:MAG TPA: hypothetical protein VKT82_23930 [Ktedonobacterales bacterium]|nr:hypothetical protein [Ktedonobacterales bacterium]